MTEFAGTPRYRIQRRLGAGGFGEVYRVHDAEFGHSVALKLLRRIDPDSILRFKREFRFLADAEHSNLVRLHDLGREDGEWFFTMELVEGVDFMRWVRGGPAADPADAMTAPARRPFASESESGVCPPAALDVARLVSAFGQLVAGVSALHQRGVLHRDLKPANVQVTEDGRVVVLDFGLLTPVTEGGFGESHGPAGTPRYMAPEQRAGEAITAAADWYAAGVILYEALTGTRPPSDGPPRVDRMDPSAPDMLRELALSLLASDPLARPTGVEIRARLDIPEPEAVPIARFVDRDEEVSTLVDALGRVEHDGPLAVLVHGPPSIGKSALLEVFVGRARREATVLFGRCLHQEQLEHKALDAVLDSLARVLSNDTRFAAPDDADALVACFPAFGRVPAMRSVEPSSDPPGRCRQRAYVALRDILTSLARIRPVVIVIDDVQWGDGPSADLVEALFETSNSLPLLVVLSYRSGDYDRSPMLRRLRRVTRDAEQLRLGPIPERAARLLLETTSGQDSARDWAREAGGNPGLLRAFARAHGAPRTLRELLNELMSALPEEARALLELVAVADRPLPWHVARNALEHPLDRTVLDRLRRARLLRVIGPFEDEELSLHHQRFRSLILDALGEDLERRLRVRLEAELAGTGRDVEGASTPPAVESPRDAEGHRDPPPTSAAPARTRSRLPLIGLALSLGAITVLVVGAWRGGAWAIAFAPILGVAGLIVASVALFRVREGLATVVGILGLALGALSVVGTIGLAGTFAGASVSSTPAEDPLQQAAAAAPAMDAETPLDLGSPVYIWSRTRWYRGEVVGVLTDGRVEVHYEGWGERWDETVARDRLRLFERAM